MAFYIDPDNGQLDGKFRSVRPEPRGLDPTAEQRRRAGLEVPGESGAMRVTQGHGHDRCLHRLAPDGGALPSKHELRRRIELGDPAIDVDGHDGVNRGHKDGAPACLAFADGPRHPVAIDRVANRPLEHVGAKRPLGQTVRDTGRRRPDVDAPLGSRQENNRRLATPRDRVAKPLEPDGPEGDQTQVMMIVAAQGRDRVAAVRGEFDRVALAADLAQERCNCACLARVGVDEQQADRILSHRFPRVRYSAGCTNPRGGEDARQEMKPAWPGRV